MRKDLEERFPKIAKFLEGNKRASEQFEECFGEEPCKFFQFYEVDQIPYGKCRHPAIPRMKAPCEYKKKKWNGSIYGIKVPKLKE